MPINIADTRSLSWDKLHFITTSTELRERVAANINEIVDEIGLRDHAAISVSELTEWFFRIFV
ncbi:MAG: hypothetical protein K0U84_18255, partial [Actinomycetia bacterium]|nr:hypothetical protein [Actinomycetes bacterium]